MAVQFVSLISRDDKPVYIQLFDTGDDVVTSADANKFLKYNFLSHMALDIFASPTLLGVREQQQEEDGGVVLLFIQDDVTVYGYETSNGLKFVVGLDGPGTSLQGLFGDIHKCYLRTVFNPFNTDRDGELPPTFDRHVKRIVAEWNK